MFVDDSRSSCVEELRVFAFPAACEGRFWPLCRKYIPMLERSK